MDTERKFLHDIATPITIIKLLTKRVLEAIEENDTEISREDQIEILKKIEKQIVVLEDFHANHKMQIK